ncbi:MAG: recombination protein RecR [Syntrophomonadaceae bacterium]|nr:recombination protein RecR [Syntrophomonadaceae bacterium]
MRLAAPLERLVDEFAKLPGIGPKTAQRLALHVMRISQPEATGLAEAIMRARSQIIHCSICGYLTDHDPCSLCNDSERDDSLLCLVEESQDVIAIDRTGFNGKFFVLNNNFQLMNGLDLRKIDFPRILEIVEKRGVKEIIVATNPTIDGEVVARYIAETTRAKGIKVSKLAYGLPVGGDIEYIDEITLRRSMDGRNEI